MRFNTRRKMIGILLAYLALALALAGYHLVNVVSLRDKFDLVEEYYRLFNNVLEVRRYEKNYIIYGDDKDLLEADGYLRQTKALADELSGNIITLVGQRDYLGFLASMDAYGKVMERTRALRGKALSLSPDEEERARANGKQMVEFTHKLLIIKRQRIKEALQRTLTVPLTFSAVVSLLLVFAGNLVSRNILRPLAIIRRTTEEVAKGNFAPIPYQANGNDEVSALVSAFNRMAMEIEARQEQLVQTRKIAAIGTFTSGVAHELNNPINNIRLTAEALLDDVDNLSAAEIGELGIDILGQADRASDIVKNLLDFSRRDLPQAAELSIADVLESTYRLVRNQIMVDGLKLQSHVPEGLPHIRGSLRNLQQVFLNLLLNAVQAMPNGGVITVGAALEGDFLRVDVTDTGTGIMPEDLEHVFDPFYTTKEVGQGTGLGLSVSYGLVKKHGGFIEVKSAAGQGTTFSVFLPPIDQTTEARA